MSRLHVDAACAAMRGATRRLRLVTGAERADLSAELERLRMRDALARGHVLVVDDEPTVAASIGKLLASHGFTVDTAHSYEQALPLLAQPLEAVVVDVSLGSRSGLDLAREARWRSTARVVLWSGAVDIEALRVAARGVGASAVVEKTAAFDDLLRAIRPAAEK